MKRLISTRLAPASVMRFKPLDPLQPKDRVVSEQTQVELLRNALNEGAPYFKQNFLADDMDIVRADLKGTVNDRLLGSLLVAAVNKEPDPTLPASITGDNIYLGLAHAQEKLPKFSSSVEPAASEASEPVSMTREELKAEVQGKIDLYTQLAAKLTPEWAQRELAKLGQIIHGAVNLIQSRNELAKGFLKALNS